jgi:disulfide bond formation protein DsbB
MSYTFQIITFLSILTVTGQVIVLILCALLIKDSFSGRSSGISSWIFSHALLLMFIVALTATSGSLFFSEIAGWAPCKDCWLQRIFMYPQVLLLGIALWKRDRHIALYIIALCLVGIYLSADHYIDQVNAALHPIVADPLKPCDATGVPCAGTEIHFTFGYITIPLMALTAFLLNALGSLFILRSKPSHS